MTTAGATKSSVVAYLESTLGLSFTGPRRERLLASIEAQRVAAGLSEDAFLAAIARPGAAFDRVVAEVTVGETYFFRDRLQCDLLRTVVLPAVSARTDHDRRVAMWSAGCASGEEAFTLAALAIESELGDRCSIVGSDASSRAIERARKAVYGAWSMRSAMPVERAAHFRQEGGQFHVAERLRQRTRFVQRNLLDGPPPPGRFDVILCRNVLIYLTREAVQQVAQVLADALTEHGWLVTAAGDPPLAGPGLEPVRTGYGLAYRRVRPDAIPAVRTAPERKINPPAAAVPSERRPAVSVPVARPARTTAPPPSTRNPTSAELLAQQVRSLGDAGRLDLACRAASAAMHAHPLDVELRYLTGVVLLEAGRLDEAVSAAASAVYLGPELAATHLLLGQVEHARGNTQRARRSFRNGSRLLAAAPSETPVPLAEDVPAGHLAAIAARYLSTHGDLP